MTPDPLFQQVRTDEEANKFLEEYVKRANSALYAFWTQVGPLQPTTIYETILQMEREGRMDLSSDKHRTNMEMMKSVLRAFSETYETCARLKAEVDRYMEIPEVRAEVEAQHEAEEARQSGRLN